MNVLQKGTAVSLLQTENPDIKLYVADMSVGLTVEKAMQSPKIFQVKKKLGEEMVIKILCVIIKSFCDSLRVKKSLDAGDILECADMIAEKYTHDSIKDIVMAFKSAKSKGKIVYNSVSPQVIFEIVTEYMDNKTLFIEKKVADMKSRNDGSTRTELNTIAAQIERYDKKMEEKGKSKELEQIKHEKKEIQKIEKFIEKNAKHLE